jgi:hypothetical protein
LVSGDGDFVPLIEAIKTTGCRTEVVSFEKSTSHELVKVADQYIPIHESWIFKEKKFEKPEQQSQQSDDFVTVSTSEGLGSTAPGEIAKDSLPQDLEEERTATSLGMFE